MDEITVRPSIAPMIALGASLPLGTRGYRVGLDGTLASGKFHSSESGRDTDLGLERGEIDCRATSDITVIRAPWNRWVKENYVTFIIQQGPEKSALLPPVATVAELARPEGKPYLNLMSVMLAYTEFDRPFAAPPGVPKERVQILRESFERMLKDAEFATEAKKLLDWDGATYLSGEQLQKKLIATITQPAEVVKRVKEIMAE